MIIQTLQGDCREVLKSLPDNSVNCCVTSPPYYGLRDYGAAGQIGLENTVGEYVRALVEVFREVKRVLRKDGTLWLNLGDSYHVGNGTITRDKQRLDALGQKHGSGGGHKVSNGLGGEVTKRQITDLKPKNLIGIPWRVALALQADGWYLRSDIIWHKPNPMPESVTDRPTKAHEYIFLLSKSDTYFYDHEAILEPFASEKEWIGREIKTVKSNSDRQDAGKACQTGNPKGRNKRSVWTVATKPYSGSHFATFPEKLIEPCILAGSPSQTCEHCGAAWIRAAETSRVTFQSVDDPTLKTGRAGFNRERPGVSDRYILGISQFDLAAQLRASAAGRFDEMRGIFGTKWDHWTRTDSSGARVPTFEDAEKLAELLGISIPFNGVPGIFKPSCNCPNNTGAGVGVVLDPFGGSGTTGRVAARYGRNAILIELNPEYHELIDERTDKVQIKMAI